MGRVSAQSHEVRCGCPQADGSTKEQRRSMYVLLWNHATQHFTRKEYRACVDLCAIGLEYAEADAKAAVARQLALAHLALKELDRSVQLAL